jgi:hypothetical protein
MTGASLLRSVKPEAVLTIDGRELAVGGLLGQPNQAYLRPEWIDGLTNDPAAFQLTGLELGKPTALFDWKRRRGAPSATPWPPPGVAVVFHYAAGMPELAGLG